jgi:hypothetical protein
VCGKNADDRNQYGEINLTSIYPCCRRCWSASLLKKNERQKQAAQISVINPDIPIASGIDSKNIRTAASRMSCVLRRYAPVNASPTINIAVPGQELVEQPWLTYAPTTAPR